MPQDAVIDALFCLPRKNRVVQPVECPPFQEELLLSMLAGGMAGAVLGPSQCLHCQHQWSCVERRNQDVAGIVARSPIHLRGLGAYDSFRIGESLRWLDEQIGAGKLAGAYVLAESSIAGLDAARMYPLYGICAMLHVPVVLDFSSRERWLHQRSQVEVVAADFPQQDILLASPPGTAATDLLRLMQRYPRVGILLSPQDLQNAPVLCEYLEGLGRERMYFRGAPAVWQAAVAVAHKLPLTDGAKRSYLTENAARMFRFTGVGSQSGAYRIADSDMHHPPSAENSQ